MPPTPYAKRHRKRRRGVLVTECKGGGTLKRGVLSHEEGVRKRKQWK